MSTLLELIKSPIKLDARKVGEYKITHHVQQDFDVVSLRESFTTGKRMERVKFPEPVTIHQLSDKDGLWIADWPIEVRQHNEAIRKMHPRGRVLVGGLGLGIAAKILAADPNVEAVDVVEISPEVVELCDPHDPKVQIHVQDLFKFIANCGDWPWSSAFFDIWRGTNEGTWWDTVLPLRRLIGSKFGKWDGDSVIYWAEDQMLGQVGARLLKETVPHWYYRECLKLPMSPERARWFIRNAGTPLWEKRYGACYPVDEFNEEDA